MKCNDNVSMKYRCYVRWTHSGREYLSEFTTETANSEEWLIQDITKCYNKQFRYTIDGKLIGVELERM
ncbi:hypothetical protein CR195_019760 [Bacillus cereus]|nr:hypothetical protein CR195_019760 [Bacillus cereus]